MNGGDRSDWASFAEQLAQNGYAAMTVDMRGHGDTGNSKDWDKTAEDLDLVWAYLAGREDVDAERIAAALERFAPEVELHRAEGVAEATRTASRLAREGETVLLAPGCSSYDEFRNYRDRAGAFRRAVEELLAAR